MAKRKWIDLTAEGFFVCDQLMPDGTNRLVLIDMNETANPDALAAISFKPLRGNVKYRSGFYYLASDQQTLAPTSLAKALGLASCPIVEVAPEEIRRVFTEKTKEKFGQNIKAVTGSSIELFRNQDGNMVFESNVGRFIQAEDGQIVTEDSKSGTRLTPVHFARVAGQDDVIGISNLCEGVLMDHIEQERRVTHGDVKKMAQAMFNPVFSASSEVDPNSIRAIHEGFEASTNRYLAKNAAAIGGDDFDRLFELCAQVYELMPIQSTRTATSISLQQYSTPAPLSVACQYMLTGSEDLDPTKTVLEPSIGNGSMLTMFSNRSDAQRPQLMGLELSPDRLNLAQTQPGITASQGDATIVDFKANFEVEDGFDYVIANPPFGQMETPMAFDKLPRVSRLDHYIMLRSLAARKDEGRSVYVFGADSNMSKGEVKGTAAHVLNYLQDHYEMEALFELDGSMYKTMGAAYNTRVAVIGNRKSEPANEADAAPPIMQLEVLQSLDELQAKAKAVVEARLTQSKDIDEVTLTPLAEDPVQTESEENVADFSFGVDVLSAEGDETSSDPVVASQSTKVSTSKAASERKSNDYQVPYKSRSMVGEPTAMIPVNMAAPVYEALANVAKEYGDIDEFVAKELDYDVMELGDYFSVEQVDAIALGLKNIKQGRGFINSDITGLGKGRFVAAMSRYAKKNGIRPVFLTFKPALFTDFFRDLKDIGSLDLYENPFIFNAGESIRDYDDDKTVLFKPTSNADRNRILQEGSLGAEYDVAFATYSQFNRIGTAKPALLESICADNALLIMDEAHLAAGEKSNTNRNIQAAVDVSDSVCYASATPIKGVGNFSIYSRVFPQSIDIQSLPATLSKGGDALQEAISANMAADGVIIRREHDYSHLTFNTTMPEEKMEQFNRETSDLLSDILLDMSFLSGDVERLVEEKNDEYAAIERRGGERMHASSMNFGSRLHNINRQFLLALKVDGAIKECLDTLERGQKPVVAVENTGESLLRRIILRESGADQLLEELELLEQRPSHESDEKERINEIKTAIANMQENVLLDEPPQFRDLLGVMLDRIHEIKIQGRYGEFRVERPGAEEYWDFVSRITQKIAQFPDLPLSPLDSLKIAIEDAGYTFSEISGRTTSLHRNEQGKFEVHSHLKSDASSVRSDYQTGKIDALAITRSGSTGISLHATDRYENADLRQRNFVVLQRAANIADFLQWLGRVNRKDQVSSPIISTIESGLPAELKVTLMHNAKLRKLSANITSNRDNANMSQREVDLLNTVGEGVAKTWLLTNPDMARKLSISPPDPKKDEAEDNRYKNADTKYISRILGRLTLLVVDEQERVIDDLNQAFTSVLEQLTLEGKNPFNVDVLDWRATPVASHPLKTSIAGHEGSSFDRPVEVVRLEYEEHLKPIRSEKLLTMVDGGYKLFSMIPSVKKRGTLMDHRENIFALGDTYIRSKLPADLVGVENLTDALIEQHPGSARAKSNVDYLKKNILFFTPGQCIQVVDADLGPRKGIVTKVDLPEDPRDFFLLSKYPFSMVFPGDDKAVTMTLATLKSNDINLLDFDRFAIPKKEIRMASGRSEAAYKLMLNDFDAAPSGKVNRVRHVLEGNIFKASELAVQSQCGRPILYTDSEGERRRAILVNHSFDIGNFDNIPVAMNPNQCKDALTALAEKASNKGSQPLLLAAKPIDSKARKGNRIIADFLVIKGSVDQFGHNNLELTLPGTKALSGSLLKDPDIFWIDGKSKHDSLGIRLAGNRKEMKASISQSMLPRLIDKLDQKGYLSKMYLHDIPQDVFDYVQEQSKDKARTALAERLDDSQLEPGMDR